MYETRKLAFEPRECRDSDIVKTTIGRYYFRIWDFMLFEFKLEKTELYVYAIIFCMYMYRHTYFQGSRAYLAKWTNSSERTVATALKSLVDKKLIVKGNKRFGKTVRAVYRINGDSLPTCDLFYFANKNRDRFAAVRADKIARGEPIEEEKEEWYDENDEFGYDEEEGED